MRPPGSWPGRALIVLAVAAIVGPVVGGGIPLAVGAEADDEGEPAQPDADAADEPAEPEGDAADEPADPDADAADDQAEADAELEAARARLERAEAELDAIDARVGAAVEALHRLREERAEAEATWEAAVTASAAATEERTEAETRLAVARAIEVEATGRLEHRAAEIYKRRSSAPRQFVLRGITAAQDLHEVAVTLRAYDRVLLNDQDLLEDAVVARAYADSAQERARRAEAAAEAAVAAAATELDRVAALVEQQEATVARVQQERRRQQAIFAELEEDAVVMVALAEKVEEQVERTRQEAPTASPTPASGGAPGWAGRLPSVGQPWAEAIAAAAARNGVDGRLLAALVWTESTFDPAAVSSAGAIGLAQLMPGTAASLGVDPWDPEANLDGGARYLRAQIDRFGSVELGLAAYNAGPGAVARYGGIPPFAQTQLYVVRVLERYEGLR